MSAPATKSDLKEAIDRMNREVTLWFALYILGFVLIGTVLLKG